MTVEVRIAVSVGCPCGVGPEVSVAAATIACDTDARLRVRLFGDRGAMEGAWSAWRAQRENVPLDDRISTDVSSDLAADDRRPGHPGAAAGRAQLDAIDAATDAVRRGECDALVTGPASKKWITASGTTFLGHTEYLESRTGADTSVMMFAGPTLRTSLVTTHVALREVSAHVTRPRVVRVIDETVRALRRDFGIARPRVVVTGLNPHAGEDGLLGREEIDVIGPAVRAAAETWRESAVIEGPRGAETAYREARDGAWDAVVAMTHDQATIASKLLDFGSAVNVTLGLPIVRTSVDHGTGYDIAGSGRADSSGMLAAMRLAAAMVRARSARA